MLIYLRPNDTESARNAVLASTLDVIENVRVLGNDLRPAAVVAVLTGDGYRAVHPADFQGELPADGDDV
jgi:hypothetical protein